MAPRFSVSHNLMREFWVFGYGSLMWRPGFPHSDAELATLYGAHRALCVYSYVHRGTPERPGLVLALDRGGACRGMAFRVAAQDAEEVLGYLRGREQVTMVYREARRPVRLGSGHRIDDAVCYIVDRRHKQYAGVLPLETQIAMVRHAQGRSGDNVSYVLNTVRHMEQAGIADARLAAVARALEGA